MLVPVTYGGVGFGVGRAVGGSALVVAFRVLVDATDVPTDRGALGRYVDGLISALGIAGADIAVVCQRADEERYRRLMPSAVIVTGPVGLGHHRGAARERAQRADLAGTRRPPG